MTRYPVYVISKGRHDCCLTANFMLRDEVPFRLVVEPQEAELYAARYGAERLLVTPFSNLGLGSTPVRNFVWEHAREAGHARHWVFDDNIRQVWRWFRGKRIPCESGPAIRCAEDFTDRYENIAIMGFNYVFFGVWKMPPFLLNCHVYSSLLIRCDLPYRWRGRYNEDTDLCLQVLSGGWCTVALNVFLTQKAATMTMRGGNTDQLYAGDGRLKMARALERKWPGVVAVGRRFKRPQHMVAASWSKFDTPLKRRKDLDWSKIGGVDNYGLELKQIGETLRSNALRDLMGDPMLSKDLRGGKA